MFYNEAGEKLIGVRVEAEDHWEACEIGHTMLKEGTVSGADDFQVVEEL